MGYIPQNLWDIFQKNMGYILQKLWDILGKNNGIYWAKTMGYFRGYIRQTLWDIYCDILVNNCWI